MKKNNKYLEIYYDCLQEEYHNKEIEHLLHILYGLVYCYERGIKEGKYTNLFMDEDSINDLRIEFISKLINIFKRIVSDNKQNLVYDTCRLLISSKGNLSTINYWLKFMFYPQEAYLEDSKNYYLTMNDIIYWHTTDSFKLDNYKSLDSDLKEMLYQYKEYLNNIPENIENDVYIKISFINYMQVVIAHYFKDKYDINIFPKVLDYVYQNIDYLDDLYEMNNIDNEDHTLSDIYICKMLVEKIIDNCTKNSRIIK